MPEITLEPTCPPLRRPERLFDPATPVHGLRAAQSRLSGDVCLVDVWLYRDPPPALADPGLWRLVPPPGGAAVEIAAASVAAAPTPHIELELEGLPAPARYRLEIDPPAAVPFDPLRTWLPARLRPECADAGECVEPAPAPAPAADSPVHDYLARDWRSLQRALVEHLVRERPGADTSIADPTIALIELYAHAGDLLHYRLDRVATEAYLETARLRTSVKRHARLVDYAIGERAAAQTYVHLALAPEAAAVTADAGDVAVDVPGSPLAFTLEASLTAEAALGEIAIYDWGEEACCLPEGATECVLVRPRPADPLGAAWLEPGDLLAFEVVDPDDRARHESWSHRDLDWPEDADGAARFREPLPSRAAQVVELTAADPFEDPLLGAGLELTRVRWRAEDALARSYPVGVDAGAGAEEVTVARGNLVRAHHGRLVDGPPGATVSRRPADGELALEAAGDQGVSLRADGSPHRLEVRVELPSGLSVPATAVRTLLEAPAGELAFVVDAEDHEPPILRFKTGSVGLAPPRGAEVAAAYEVGGGAVGNVAANSLRLLERNAAAPGQRPEWDPAPIAVRNPAPAAGGADPTPLEVVRRDAPEAFAAEPRRAVLAADHAAAASRSPLVERAMARREWSGSWPVIATVVDLETGDSDAARAEIRTMLDDLRMIGTEAAVVSGAAVGLLLALDVCARPRTDAEALRRDVLALLRPGTGERPGVFHPSRLELGRAVYVSAVLAALAGLAGVDAVEAIEARRLSDPPGTVREVIELGADEVAVLDDDPARPERGRLDIRVRGGS